MQNGLNKVQITLRKFLLLLMWWLFWPDPSSSGSHL